MKSHQVFDEKGKQILPAAGSFWHTAHDPSWFKSEKSWKILYDSCYLWVKKQNQNILGLLSTY